jgi:hypothetical protein
MSVCQYGCEIEFEGRQIEISADEKTLERVLIAPAAQNVIDPV